MSNIVEVDLWHEVYSLADCADGFIEWLDPLATYIVNIRVKCERAKSLSKVLEYYAQWLRRFYEQRGIISIELQRLNALASHERAKITVAEIELRISSILSMVSGSQPWTCVTSLKRAKAVITHSLDKMFDWLCDAIHWLQLMVEWSRRPKRGAA